MTGAAHRIEVGYRAGVTDARGEGAARRIREFLHIGVSQVRTRQVYWLRLPISAEQARLAAEELFCDPIIQDYSLDACLDGPAFDFAVTVGFKPGVTDNVGRTATAALEEVLGVRHDGEEGVATAVQYLLSGVDRAGAERIAAELLCNPLIEEAAVQDHADWRERGVALRRDGSQAGPAPEAPGAAERPAGPPVGTVRLEGPDERLAALSAERVLALSVAEMKAVRDHYRRPEVLARRAAEGLGPDPTDVELEAIAQTWSEHCHHKVFNGVIHYEEEGEAAASGGAGAPGGGPDPEADGPRRGRRTIRSLFATYIKRVTEELDRPWLLSVFSDNAGVIRFNDRLALVYKVETHNSPSALDPYGGAMTGIVGVNRDPFGTGMGARLIANVWGYCLGDPFMTGGLPKGLLHPRRIRDGVHRGVIEGGNQSGVPYLRGWELFEDRFMGKPLVFCGTLGEMPLAVGPAGSPPVPPTRKRSARGTSWSWWAAGWARTGSTGPPSPPRSCTPPRRCRRCRSATRSPRSA